MVDHKASTKELRSFGLLVGGVFSVIGLWPMVLHGEPLRLWAVIVGGLLMMFGGLLPRVLSPVHQGWMWIGHVLGWINTRILLGVVFYGLVTPIGIVFRLMGKDTMRQAFSETRPTYRVIRQPRPRSHMKYQF
jgi:polyferredoxin